MKLFTAVLVLLGAAAASATAVAEPVDTECANQGGLFEVELLPEGVTSHRKCAGHPLGDHSTTLGGLHKRACAVRKYGCENKFCWKKCSSRDGPWCWQAWNFGSGDWVGCTKDSDCEPGKLSRADCGICSGASCGCSC